MTDRAQGPTLPVDTVRYYADQLRRAANELEGLGYSLASMVVALRKPIPQSPHARELLGLAGNAARCGVQITHLLEQVSQLLLAAESLASKTPD